MATADCYHLVAAIPFLPSTSLSNPLKCTASATCSIATVSLPARSAIVRLTFKILAYDRAETSALSSRPNRYRRAYVSSRQYSSRTLFRHSPIAIDCVQSPKPFRLCGPGLHHRARMTADDSTGLRESISSPNGTDSTSTCRSIRSMSGPDVFRR